MTGTLADDYALGRSEGEIQRLIAQGRRLAFRWRRFLEDAGIEPGMKVLDLGSGAGDTTIGVAELVGPSGTVVGIEMDGGHIKLAERRIEEIGLQNVTFVQADLREQIDIDNDFDAIVGRLVLGYLPDPAGTLRMLLPHLKSGGIVAITDKDIRVPYANLPPMPLHERVADWSRQGQLAAGTDMYLGLKLYGLMCDAGLEPPSMTAICEVTTPETAHSNPIAFLRTIAPQLLKAGIVTEDDLDLDRIERELREELEATRAVSIASPDIYAWARKP